MAGSRSVSIRMPEALAETIDAYAAENGFESRSEAARSLIVAGLSQSEAQERMSSRFRADLVEVAAEASAEQGDRVAEVLLYLKAVYYLTLLSQWQVTDNSMEALKEASMAMAGLVSPDLFLDDPEDGE